MPLTITINEAAPGTLTIGVGTPGVGVPAGGTAGQYLVKTSNADFVTGWSTLSLSGYLPLAGGTMDANATIDLEDTVLDTVSEVGGYGFAVSSATNVNLKTNVLFDRVLVGNATSTTTLKPTGVEFPDLTLQTSAGISAATAASTFYPLSGNPSGFLTSAPVTSVAGMTGAVVLANTDISGLGTMSTATAADYSTTVQADGLYYPLSGNPSAFLTDAPSDGSTYGRNNGAWAVAGGGGLITSVTSPLSVTSGDLSVDLSAYLPLTGGNITTGSSYTNLAPALVGVATVSLPDFAYLEPNSIKAEHAETDGYGSQQYTTTVTAQQTNFAYAGPGPYGGQTGASSISYSNLSFNYNLGGITGTGSFNPSGITATVVNAISPLTTTYSLSGSGLAWNNGTVYGEFNSTGVRFPDGTTQSTAASAGIPDAPSDSQYYARLNANWTNFSPGFGADAPSDGTYYARQNGAWAMVVPEAPYDGTTYGRNNNAWVATAGNPPNYNSVWAYGGWQSASVTTIFDTVSMMYYNVLTF